MRNHYSIMINLLFLVCFPFVLIISGILLRNQFRRLAVKERIRVKSAPSIKEQGREFRKYLRSLKDNHESIDVVAQLGFDPTGSELSSLKNFRSVKQKTACVFAKRSLLWGSPDWVENLSLEQNALRIAPALKLFMTVAKGLALDGFVLEVKGEKYCKNLEKFSRTVYFMLRALCDLEDEHCGCMRRTTIGEYGWWFDYAKEYCFVTTFAPFYASTHSRHQYDAPSDSCFIVFQPEFAFARRNISCGHEPTNWNNPKTERDIVRHSFRTANQNYVITADDQPDELFVEKLRPVLERRYAKRGLTVDFADPHFSPAHQVYGPTSWQIVKDGTKQSFVEWWNQAGNTFE